MASGSCRSSCSGSSRISRPCSGSASRMRAGQMAPGPYPLFNLMHHPVPPLMVLGLAAVGILSPFWLVGGLAWFSHIVMDLAFGQGLRTADGWRRPWWPAR